jgi:hypothetical protein
MKPWTVLVYLAGDNGRFLSSLEGEGVADLSEMKDVGSDDGVDIVAQFDAMSERTCRRYHISRGGTLAGDLVHDLGDTNSGDPQVLLDFVTWGVRSFPAERYLLVLWNHGSGWKDDDIYAPYRALVRRGKLPPVPPQIAGRRVSRALFRRSLDSVVEEEANQALLATAWRHRSADAGAAAGAAAAAANGLPPGWMRGLEAPAVGGALPTEPITVQALRGSRPPQARAICFDDSSKDFLDSRELSAVLAATAHELGRKVDVLGFDACLMSMIEVAYQARDGAAIMVASEDVEPGSGWPYRDILTTLSADPSLSPADLGRAIARRYTEAYDRSLLSGMPVTQAALNLERVSAVVEALDDLARGLLGGLRRRAMRSALAEARRQAQTFADTDYIDLYDFVALLMQKTGAQPLRAQCERVLAAIDPGKAGSLVLAEGHAGLSERNAHGLSIYFPKIGVSPFYAGLDMSRDCAWAQLLDVFCG